ncbi:MAG: multicopper oxidase domain-containing protein [bacterium]|nr:multicopper oxidase domain-containing protein [bacterium]
MRSSTLRLAMALAASVVLAGAAGTGADAAEFNLRAEATALVMPDGRSIPMWGFALDSAPGANDGPVTVPGPLLEVPPDDATLTIRLANNLPEPVSIVIPGLITSMTPVRDGDGRIRSFAAETAPGGTGVYTWPNCTPGTYIYYSGTHAAVQVQMGLYGGVKKDAAPKTAHPGVPYDRDLLLLFSEIDPALHDAVAAPGGYGPGTAMTSTINYSPNYFLINGKAFPQAAPIFAGRPGERILLRFANAGLKTRIPIVPGLYLSVLGEDGSLFPYPKEQYTVDLLSLKTVEALIAPTGKGNYAVFDRRLGLANAASSPGGMLAYLGIYPPLMVETSADAVARGETFSLDVKLSEDLTQPFDVYLVVDTPGGAFTVGLDGETRRGIRPLFRNVQGFPAPFWTTIWEQIRVPLNIVPGIYTFYVAAIEAGTVPPIATLGDLNEGTPHVIMFDAQPVEVQ